MLTILYISVIHLLTLLLLQVYYLPFPTMYNQCILPTILTTLPLLRNIFIRENISIVHGHSVCIGLKEDFTSVFASLKTF